MSNDYSSDPPIATAGQLLAISDKINDISKNMDKLAEMPQKLDRMNMQLEQLNKDHQQTRSDLSQTRDNLQDELDRTKSNFKGEIKQIKQDMDARLKETDLSIRLLNENKAKGDTIAKIVHIGGPILIGAILTLWSTQSSKTDAATSQSANNNQRIVMLEKQSDQTLRTLEEIRNKLYERSNVRGNNEIN